MHRWLLCCLSLALSAAPTASAAGVLAAPRATSAAPNFAYLTGRWCDSTGAWMTFDPVTREINLPNGNTGTRVTGNYQLAGNILTIKSPAGAILTLTLRRIDAETMSMVSDYNNDIVRRCAAGQAPPPTALPVPLPLPSRAELLAECTAEGAAELATPEDAPRLCNCAVDRHLNGETENEAARTCAAQMGIAFPEQGPPAPSS